MSNNDPFVESNPLWQPYAGPIQEREFGGVDNPAHDLNEFLREEARARAKHQVKPQPQSEPFRIGHIPGTPL
jgi:hypothetical protein